MKTAFALLVFAVAAASLCDAWLSISLSDERSKRIGCVQVKHTLRTNAHICEF